MGTAMIFDFPPISPQVIRKCLIGHIYSRYSTSGFIFGYLILVHSVAKWVYTIHSIFSSAD